MKRNIDAMGMPISKEELNELLKETKETIALNCGQQNTAGFAAVNLWNVQKKHRSALDLRRRLN
jgi:hypothetical protein